MLDRLSLNLRMWLVVGTYWVIFVIALVVGANGLIKSHDSFASVHDHRMAVSEMVGSLSDDFYDIRLNALLSFQHAPASTLVALHSHEIAMHLGAVATNQAKN